MKQKAEEEIPAANNDTKSACNDILPKEFTKEHPSPKSSSLLQQKEFENSKVSKDSYYEDTDLREAVCRLTLHNYNGDLQGGGTGFFARYDQHAGFFTNNHVLNEEHFFEIRCNRLYANISSNAKIQIHRLLILARQTLISASFLHVIFWM